MKSKIDNRLPEGTRVNIIHGIDRGYSAIVVSHRRIKTDMRGIPDIGQGHYKPVNWDNERAIQFDCDGHLDTKPVCFLQRIPQ